MLEPLLPPYQGPTLRISTHTIKRKVYEFWQYLPTVTAVHYAVKANPHPQVISTLTAMGVRFEVASINELELVWRCGGKVHMTLFSNPIKKREDIKKAAEMGVRWFCVDSISELIKVHELVPYAKTYLRISVSNDGSVWPLDGKFGASDEVEEIIKLAAGKQWDLAGVTFHVGSQCNNPQNWANGISKALGVFNNMKHEGLNPTFLDLGGGYPVEYISSVDFPAIAMAINEGIREFKKQYVNVHVVAEPGRFLVAESGTLECQVLAIKISNGIKWVHLDIGVFGGLIEPTQGIIYDIQVSNSDSYYVPCTLAGPTCDSADVIYRNVLLPCTLREGDLLQFKSTGAYTTAYATNFNGFEAPTVIVI